MAHDGKLSGCAVLVLEDIYIQAEALRKLLVGESASVVGPFPDAAQAIASADLKKPTCALIDLNLGEGASFAPAKALLARGVPVAFLTGYSAEVLPPELSKVPLLEKPAESDEIVALVRTLCNSRSRALH